MQRWHAGLINSGESTYEEGEVDRIRCYRPLLLMGCLLIAACKDVRTDNTPAKVRDATSAYAELRLTNETRHQALRNELALVKSENGFPLSITSRRIRSDDGQQGWQSPGGRLVPDADNAAIGMIAAIPLEKRARLRRQIERSYPKDLLRCTALELEHIHDVLGNWIAEGDAFEQALQRPSCDFGFPYTEGLTADLASIDVVILGHRLLALKAIDAAYRDELDIATNQLTSLFRIPALLAAESSLTMRTAAARLRKETLGIVELIIQHPSVTSQPFELIRSLVAQQLADWPDDAETWRGERAIGLHVYEMVRNGQILSLLNAEEAKKVMDEGPLRFGRAILKTIDDDELLYLRTMRALIEVSHVPYYQRLQTLEELEDDLVARRDGPDQAFVANLLLREDLQWGQRVQGADRATMEAWHAALSAAAGEEFAEPPLNFFTGQPLRVVNEGARIELHGLNPAEEPEAVWKEPIVVPRMEEE